MNLEVGDKFVVTRGVPIDIELGEDDTCVILKSDRSHENILYEVLEVAGEHVVVKTLYHPFDKDRGRRLLNTAEMEVMTVTESFYKCLVGAGL